MNFIESLYNNNKISNKYRDIIFYCLFLSLPNIGALNNFTFEYFDLCL